MYKTQLNRRKPEIRYPRQDGRATVMLPTSCIHPVSQNHPEMHTQNLSIKRQSRIKQKQSDFESYTKSQLKSPISNTGNFFQILTMEIAWIFVGYRMEIQFS
jgi:hypothetical protein